MVHYISIGLFIFYIFSNIKEMTQRMHPILITVLGIARRRSMNAVKWFCGSADAKFADLRVPKLQVWDARWDASAGVGVGMFLGIYNI